MRKKSFNERQEKKQSHDENYNVQLNMQIVSQRSFVK